MNELVLITDITTMIEVLDLVMNKSTSNFHYLILQHRNKKLEFPWVDLTSLWNKINEKYTYLLKEKNQSRKFVISKHF